MKISNKKTLILNSLLINPLIKYLIIPLTLLLLWLTLSLAFSLNDSFTVITLNNIKAAKENSIIKLLKGKNIKGSFKAENNNLGIVTLIIGNVPINEYEKQDFIVFRIKEKGTNKWISENTYNSGSFLPNKTFPIGFKEQHQSKDKTYEIEIISKNGNFKNAIEIKLQGNNPIYQTKYKFTKDEIFENKSTFWNFIQYKLKSFFTNNDALYSSVIYLLPFLFYLAWVFLPIQVRIKKLSKFTIIIVLLILFDVISLKFTSSGIILGLTVLWIYTLLLNRYRSDITFKLSFILLLISLISIYLDLGFLIDKATTYVYLLLIIGFLHSLYENKILQKISIKHKLFQKWR